MADQKETIILDFQVEQGSAIQELERTKKSILQIKQEQTELTKAYKAGNVTLEEYVTETVRLEAILKKQQSTYTNTQKSVTGVKTKMDDLIKSNQNLNKSLEHGLNNATIFGTNLGGLKNSVTALANPITATVAIVGALGAAYARSTIGAKDLEFASNQLGAATTILTNEFASLISSSEDGEGAFSKITDQLLSALSPALAARSKAIALALEAVGNLSQAELDIRGNVSDRLSENQDIISEINNEQTEFNKKLQLTDQLEQNIRRNTQELLVIKGEQLKSAQNILEADSQNSDKQRAVKIVEKEIDKILLDESKKLNSIDVLTNNIRSNEDKRLSAIDKQNKALQFQQSEIERNARISQLEQEQQGPRPLGGIEDPFGLDALSKRKIQITSQETDALAKLQKKQRDDLKKTTDFQKEQNKIALEQSEKNFNNLALLFSEGSEARKLFALAAIGVDTAQAIASLTAASEANPANAFTFGGAGIAQYAAGIIRILSNIVAAKEFLGGSFAGGADFVTTKPTMIMVGDNPGNRERVTVEPLSGRGKSTYNPNSGFAAFAGGGSMTFDGAKDLAVQNVQQNLSTANAIKRMPIPEVSVKEVTKVQRRIRVKETISSR